jgi:hypothetical protein
MFNTFAAHSSSLVTTTQLMKHQQNEGEKNLHSIPETTVSHTRLLFPLHVVRFRDESYDEAD